MRERDRYLKVVQWSEDDQCYVGTCPGFMLGGVHGDDEVEVYRELCEAVEGWIQTVREDGEPLPPATVAAEPSETETWVLSGKPPGSPWRSQPTDTCLTLYRMLGESGSGSEIAEPQVLYGDERDEAREQLASLIEEAVVPWTRIAGWRDDEGIRHEIERRIWRQLRAARHSREQAERLVQKIVGLFVTAE